MGSPTEGRKRKTYGRKPADDPALSTSPGPGPHLPHRTLGPHPVTAPRIRSWLQEQGFSYSTDERTGEIYGLWGNRPFFFMSSFGNNSEEGSDQVVIIRGTWNRYANIDHLPDIIEVCNQWNSERIYPKTYASVRDDGTVVICADLIISVAHGLNDEQLDVQLACGLSTGTMFFDFLDHHYPDPLQAASS